MLKGTLISAGCVAACVLALGFGLRVSQGAYFGPCDNVRGEQCTIVHVWGVVMHRDVPDPVSVAPPAAPQASTGPGSPGSACAAMDSGVVGTKAWWRCREEREPGD